jgi:DNA polymerase (family 10)
MPLTNKDIAEIFYKLAELLELDEADTFRVRAYENAAVYVDNSKDQMADLIDQGRILAELPRIGGDISGKIAEIIRTGELKLLKDIE